MEPIIREATRKTPFVILDAASGIIEIKGRSIPENSLAFYEQIASWLEQYGSSPSAHTIVNFQLEYFNTSSSKCILDILKRLELISKMGNSVEINWFYEELGDDIFEAGEDYQTMININALKFNLIEIEQ
ncbi:MAG: DUF1987 domain-containing protein [Breznakibacter sp.]|nr:DUF1987 domain-containing protein [Breznakibacter sp.]